MESVLPDFPIAEVEQATEPPSHTYKMDLDKGVIVGMVDGREAVMQAIRKALITPRFKCLIYDNQYGSEIKQNIIAEDATPEYIQTEMPRLIKDALSPDTRILQVYNFSLRIDGEAVYVKFDVDTVFGQMTIEEAI